MHRFAALYQALDASTATTDKVAAMRGYYAVASAADAAWATYFLCGGKPRQAVPTATLRRVATEMAGIDEWLFEECYQVVGDLAETITLLLPEPPEPPEAPNASSAVSLAHWVEHRLLVWRTLDPLAQAAALREALQELDAAGRFLLIKLIGGGFRVGVSKLLVQRALAEHIGIDAKRLAERFIGYTDARHTPTAERFLALTCRLHTESDPGQPFPFFLAHPLQAEPASLGDPALWLAEWKYDGIRAQIVKRVGRVWIWSRGEELVSERFPEVVALAAQLPDGTVLDGELLAWLPGSERPAPFQLLQQRITRKTLSKKILQTAPVRFMAYDLLEHAGVDIRHTAQHSRRAALEQLLSDNLFSVSPLVPAKDWAQLAAQRSTARERGVEGLMLKHRASAYGSGRSKAEGSWWKWKIEPLTIDAVLIYAQAGHGRRASVYTDYTFALWSRAPANAAEAQTVVEAITRREPAVPGALQLVPFAKAYSGLSDAEFAAVSKVVREHTLEKFGPVRSVRPTLVFELAFEAVQLSKRHKSGIAVRFPRMLRIRHDKLVHEADNLPALRTLLHTFGEAPPDAGPSDPGGDMASS
jgi:DNA ligase 1